MQASGSTCAVAGDRSITDVQTQRRCPARSGSGGSSRYRDVTPASLPQGLAGHTGPASLRTIRAVRIQAKMQAGAA
jgi:hypothetical protein